MVFRCFFGVYSLICNIWGYFGAFLRVFISGFWMFQVLFGEENCFRMRRSHEKSDICDIFLVI